MGRTSIAIPQDPDGSGKCTVTVRHPDSLYIKPYVSGNVEYADIQSVIYSMINSSYEGSEYAVESPGELLGYEVSDVVKHPSGYAPLNSVVIRATAGNRKMWGIVRPNWKLFDPSAGSVQESEKVKVYMRDETFTDEDGTSWDFFNGVLVPGTDYANVVFDLGLVQDTSSYNPAENDTASYSKSFTVKMFAPRNWVPDFRLFMSTWLDFGGRFYKDLSSCTIEIDNASSTCGASITSKAITFDGKSSTGNALVVEKINSSGNLTASATVTDSRGRSVTKTFDVQVYEHAAPTVEAASVTRCDEDGEEADEGTIAMLTLVASPATDIAATTITGISVRHRETGTTTWISDGDVTLDDGGHAGVLLDAAGEPVAFDAARQYEVEVTVTDCFGFTATRTLTLLRAFMTMDFLAGGRGIAFGQPAIREGFDCGMDAYFNGDVTFTDAVMSKLFLAMHPVGSVYLSFESTSPQDTYGGTWTQLTGVFPRFSNDTDTGGSDSVTLTAEQMPKHSHSISTSGKHSHTTGSAGKHSHSTGGAGAHEHMTRKSSYSGGSCGLQGGGSFAGHALIGYDLNDSAYGTSDAMSAVANHSHSVSEVAAHSHSVSEVAAHGHTAGDAGGGKPFDNRPKYQDVYAWRRVA